MTSYRLGTPDGGGLATCLECRRTVIVVEREPGEFVLADPPFIERFELWSRFPLVTLRFAPRVSRGDPHWCPPDHPRDRRGRHLQSGR